MVISMITTPPPRTPPTRAPIELPTTMLAFVVTEGGEVRLWFDSVENGGVVLAVVACSICVALKSGKAVVGAGSRGNQMKTRHFW